MKSAFQHTVFYLLSLFFSIFLFTISFAQEMEYEKIKGDISNEVYDLHFDKNGLLWVGHAGGISSYDGRKFRHYYNPEQLSTGMTGLCEDSSGRIWCYNFSGQIWYVEKGRLHLLKAYQYKNEIYFPRIGIFRNELIATTKTGFFVFNTVSKKAQYFHLGTGYYSLAILDQKVILIDFNKNWAVYEGIDKPILRIKETRITGLSGAQLLFNSDKKNEFFLSQAPQNILYTIKIDSNQILFKDSIRSEGFINGISKNQNSIWVHTKISSKSLNTNEYIKNFNISDLIEDKNGTKWISSLSSGLYRINKKNEFKRNISELLNIKERIVSVTGDSFYVALGTESGKLMLLEYVNGIKKKNEINLQGYGSVEKIFRGNNHEFLCASSMGLNMYNYKINHLKNIIKLRTIKDVFIGNKICIFSTTSEFLWINQYNNQRDTSWVNVLRTQFPFLGLQRSMMPGFYCSDITRTKSSCIINDSILFRSQKNGIFITTKSINEQLIYKNIPLLGNQLYPYKDRVLIGTINHGLLLWNKFQLKPILINRNILQGIRRIKEIGEKIFIFCDLGIFNFNPQTEQLKRLNLIDIPHNTILDIEKINNDYLIATSEGLIKIPINVQPASVHLSTNPVFCTVNQSDTITKNFFKLSHSENDLMFFYSAPWYGAKEDIEIIYRLTHNQKGFWQTTTAEEDFLHFPSLEPGNYTLEIKVRNRHTEKESNPATWNFMIKKPWWELLIARIFFGFVLGMIVYISIRRVYQKKLEKQLQIIEKQQAVLSERKRIAADMHDELGAGISSLQLMSEMSALRSNERNIKDELAKINLTAKDLGNKVREIVWTLNPQNDSLENLLFYISKYGHDFFSKTNIHFKCILPESIPVITITGGCRHHIVLMIKEIFNNIVKHANASEVNCTFSVDHEFEIKIHDNGKGFVKQQAAGNGLKNIEERIKLLSGSWNLDTHNGVSIHLQIPFQHLKNDLDT